MIAIATMCKKENPYVNEWVAWHLNIGFDRVYIYDDNDPDYPYVGDCIDEEYRDKVFIVRYNNVLGDVLTKQALMINQFVETMHGDIEWCAFIDGDEFIHIDNYPSVGEWLSHAPEECECVALNWHIYDDNDIIVGDESAPVQERFTRCADDRLRALGVDSYRLAKKIVRLHRDITADDMFYFRRDGVFLDMYDSQFNNLGECMAAMLPETTVGQPCYINHYVTKSASECLKYKVGALWGESTIEDYFFKFNIRTPEKEKYIEEHTPTEE